MESYQRVSGAIQAVADWVDGNLSSFVWDTKVMPSVEEEDPRREGIRHANETLGNLAIEANTRHIDVPEFQYGIERVQAAGFLGWHGDGRLVRAVYEAISEQV